MTAKPNHMPRFPKTYCSQCGEEFGPGDSGFSHCADHGAEAHPAPPTFAGRKIITDYWAKPVPFRNFDWSATFDDYGGPGWPIGSGSTEQAAIEDLIIESGLDEAEELAREIERLKPKAETGAQWARICALEARLVELEAEDCPNELVCPDGQFGVGA